jgi:hypothetical protein
MGRSARVTSIEMLPLLSAALQKFRAEGVAAMDDLEIELRRAIEWVQHDRRDYWTHELRRAQEALTQAKLKLQQARMVKRIGDHEPACSDEKRAVEKAKRRVEIAQRKVEAVRHWSMAIEKAADDFRRVRSQFIIWMEVDISRASASLNQMSETLVNYISMEMPTDSEEPAAEAVEEAKEPAAEDGSVPGENRPPDDSVSPVAAKEAAP